MIETPIVTKVAVIRPFTLEVTFQDGQCRVVEMKEDVKDLSGDYELLKNAAFFATVFIDPVSRTLAWPNGVSLAAEWFYDKKVEVNRADAGLNDFVGNQMMTKKAGK